MATIQSRVGIPAPDAGAVSSAAADPIALRIRERRLGLGWSLKRLSAAAGGLAPSFIFNIEAGRKVPSEEVAARIAQALGDEEHEPAYRAWARIRSRGRTGRVDHATMLESLEQMRSIAGGADAHAPAPHRDDTGRDTPRLSVPVLARGADPGDGVRPPAESVVNTLRLDPRLYGDHADRARAQFERLRRPFAFELGAAQAARVPGLIAGYLAIVDRPAVPGAELDPAAAYVVREGAQLEVLSGAALASADDAARARIVGRIAMLLPGL